MILTSNKVRGGFCEEEAVEKFVTTVLKLCPEQGRKTKSQSGPVPMAVETTNGSAAATGEEIFY